MNEWRKAELSERKEPILPRIGQPTILYCCPHDRTNLRKLWKSDIGDLRMEAGAPVWRGAVGSDSQLSGMKFADILTDYDVCFAEVPPLDAQGWLNAIPVGQSAVLCRRPLGQNQAWETDIGSLYAEAGALLWESAFGFQSEFDGVKFEDIVKNCEVCFAEIPPLEAGRFPSPLDLSVSNKDFGGIGK